MGVRTKSNRRNLRLGPGTILTFILLGLLHAGPGSAQNPHESLAGAGAVPDVPPGAASILGQMLHPDGNEKTEGSAIVLYSLAADGNPGFRTSTADASGAFRFVDLSNAAGITYLVGASYRGVPYGKRVVFEPGQSEISLVIDVADPISDISSVSIGESSLRFEWIGASLGIEEVHQIENSASEVVFVAPEKRSSLPPLFRTTLPQQAEGIDTSLGGNSEGYEIRGDQLLYWGPAYSGGFELRFRYRVPIASSSGTVPLQWQINSGSSRMTLLYPPGGPSLSGEGLSPASDVTLGDRTYHSLDAGEVTRGSKLDVSVSLPEMTSDGSAISISRANLWLEADDVFLQVSVEISLTVAADAYLAGTAEAPLLEFDLPPGAEFLGHSPESRNMGLLPTPGGDLALLGPLSPGSADLAFRFRLPVHDSKPQIDIRLPGAVDVLNVLIADTGVVVETDRLHRRRPFRQGTRVYLHREAFAVDADEVISIGLALIDRGAFDRNTHLFATSALAGLGVWIIASPLVRGRRTHVSKLEQARIRSERELIYQAIRDLEHDFETAKIEDAEYQPMRTELRARALVLLQQERDAKLVRADPQPPQPPKPPDRCHHCGSGLDAGWRFCPQCGASSTEPANDDADVARDITDETRDVTDVPKEEP